MKNIFCYLILALTVNFNMAWAKSVHFEFTDYSQAEKSASFLKFTGTSTKAGLFSTSFDGYVKAFDVTAEVTDNSFKSVKVKFQTESLDTDNNSRNEKMWEKCLDSKNNPEIIIELSEPVLKNSSDQEISGTILIRAAHQPIKLKINTTERESEFTISGETAISLKETKIPDPSILVASVKDKISISFNLVVKKFD